MNGRMDPQSTIYTATAPSNIAFIKYWGKRDVATQWPANDSLSMTLAESRTITTARISALPFDRFIMSGKTLTSQDHGDHKIFRHIHRVREHLGLSGHLDIASENTFPMGCGIASSASGFAALTLATTAALTGETSWDALSARGVSRARLADWARQGSGSAGRSLFGGIVRWTAGQTPESQTIGEVFPHDHWRLADVIVVFSDQEKHTSSSQAHLAAWGSPLFNARLGGIAERMDVINKAITNRDLETLGREIESDAMEMHAVAMTGSPAVNYFTEDTRNFIGWARRERGAGNLPAWFTIDAGPNVHLICREDDADQVAARVKREWKNARVIRDRIGRGPSIERRQPNHDDAMFSSNAGRYHV